MIDIPGAFELGNLMIQAHSVRAYNDEKDVKTGVLYKFVADRVSAVVVGHMHPDADTTFLESLSPVDVVFAPVGGNDYTLDVVSVQKIVNKINPRYFVPTHYADDAISYPIAQDPLSKLIEELGQAVEEQQDTLKLKASLSPEHNGTQLIVLKRAA
jgi:L-ascorbate metabolism protein UlaG (beta-lactamase superfamily)